MARHDQQELVTKGRVQAKSKPAQTRTGCIETDRLILKGLGRLREPVEAFLRSLLISLVIDGRELKHSLGI